MKRILVFALLLALAVPARGARTLYPVQSPASMDWSASTWALSDGGTADEDKPAEGDTVYLTANSGDVALDENSAALALFRMDYPTIYTGILALGANTLTVDGPCVLRGTITETGTIEVGDGNLLNYATVADAITLLLTTSGSHTIIWGGTGGSVNINCTGDYTVNSACDSYALTVTAGTLTGGEYTWTVGAGGFTFTDGTISGTLTVDLSAAAGAYTQTNGEIAAAAVLRVAAGSGGFSFTALTLTGSLYITQAATSTAVEWASVAANAITCLTINSAVEATLAGGTVVKKCVNNGIITAGGHSFQFFRPTANDFWSGSGTYSGTSTTSGPILSAARSNAAAIVWNAPMRVLLEKSGVILTASGGIDCGNLVVEGPNTAGQWGGLTLPDGANLSCANLTLGRAASDRSGKVVLGAGAKHAISGAISNPGSAQVSAITFGGRVYLGGSYDGTGITPTWGGALFATGNLTFDGQEVAGANASPGMDIFANAKTVTVQGVNNSTAATPIRVWNNATAGAANTNCVFHPGAPSGLSMTGMGL